MAAQGMVVARVVEAAHTEACLVGLKAKEVEVLAAEALAAAAMVVVG